MKKSDLARRSRQALDDRFRRLSRPSFAPPARGWVKAIRTALGMSAAQLAKRLGITQPSVADMERSEEIGTVQLSTLRRAAEAMNCTLVYALIPNKPLETMVDERAREIARRQLRAVEHSMRLERQGVASKDFEYRLTALAKDISSRVLWDEQ